MVNVPGAIIGALIDRRDGDSGIKGAVAGSVAQGALRKLFPILGAVAFGLVAHKALKSFGVRGDEPPAV